MSREETAGRTGSDMHALDFFLRFSFHPARPNDEYDSMVVYHFSLLVALFVSFFHLELESSQRGAIESHVCTN
jgi:hypothetical protein